MSAIIEKVRRHGLGGSAKIAARMVRNRFRRWFDGWRFRNAPRYANPTSEELARIESDLTGLGINIEHCPHCGGTLKIIAAIEDPAVINRILVHLGLPTRHLRCAVPASLAVQPSHPGLSFAA